MSLLNQRGIPLGVVGVSYWGSELAGVLRPTPGVASAIAVGPMSNAAGRGGLRGKPFGNLHDAGPQVDAAVIATAPSTHVELGPAAGAAGKQVLIERLLATLVQQGVGARGGA